MAKSSERELKRRRRLEPVGGSEFQPLFQPDAESLSTEVENNDNSASCLLKNDSHEIVCFGTVSTRSIHVSRQ